MIQYKGRKYHWYSPTLAALLISRSIPVVGKRAHKWILRLEEREKGKVDDGSAD